MQNFIKKITPQNNNSNNKNKHKQKKKEKEKRNLPNRAHFNSEKEGKEIIYEVSKSISDMRALKLSF